MSLQYYRNPFVRNEHQPKIPDAKMDTSVGARVTRSFEFQMGGTTADPNGTSNYEEMYIFSLPGISSTVVPFRYNAGTPDVIYTPDQKFAKFEFDEFLVWRIYDIRQTKNSPNLNLTGMMLKFLLQHK